MITVAFTLIGGNNWVGGLNYQINLLNALLKYQPDLVCPILFIGDDVDEDCIERLQEVRDLHIVHSPVFNKNRAKGRLIRSLLYGQDRAALGIFNEFKVDIVFESAVFFGWRFPLKTIAWVPDLQHKRLRSYFSPISFWKREIGFRSQMWAGRHVMVSSEDARQDLQNFYNNLTDRVHVVRFSVPVKSEPFNQEALRKKYELPEKFFYLPNQFWRHKNHECVIHALAIAKEQGKNITIAVSGHSHDPRDPKHFDNLMKLADSLGVSDYFKVLGLIPYSDVQALMQSCIALINPSSFEGWSTTVEEAKALGTKMLLSDINVHHEQAGNRAEYFATNAPKELARLLLSNDLNTPKMPFFKQQEISAISEKRMARFASDFVSMLNSAIKT